MAMVAPLGVCVIALRRSQGMFRARRSTLSRCGPRRLLNVIVLTMLFSLLPFYNGGR
jgi:hypothetical protein